MQAPESFETKRLLIRRCKSSDAEAVYNTYASKQERVRYISWKAHRTIADTREFLEVAHQNFDSGKDFAYALVLKENNTLVGSIGMVNEGGRVFIGYIIGKEYERKGYTTEAVKCMLSYLSNQHGVFRIWACCAVENIASAKVLEKAGMLQEALVKDWVIFPNLNNQPRDCYFYYYPKPE